VEKKHTDLFAFDLDGTLVHRDVLGQRIIPGILLTELFKIAEQAHMVIATGRRYRAAFQDIQVLPKMPFAIVNNGVVIKDGAGITVHRTILTPKEAHAIATILEGNGLDCFFVVDGYDEQLDFIFAEDQFHRSEALQVVYNRTPQTSLVLKNRDDLLSFSQAPIVEIAALGPYHDLLAQQQQLVRLLPESVRAVVIKNIGYEGWAALEILRSTSSKWTAVEYVKEKLGATRVIAIGDDENDMEMIKSADVGIVMSHAEPHVLKASLRRAEGAEGLAAFLREFYSR